MDHNEAITPTVQLGGRMWPIRMTHRVLMLFSSATKMSMDQLQYQIGRYDYMVLLLWLMLQEQDPQLKRAKFEGWLDDLGVKGVIPLLSSVGEAMQAAFPSEEETEAEEADSEDAEDDEAEDPTETGAISPEA